MSSVSDTNHETSDVSLPTRIPPLRNGDRLTLGEYWRRYLAMPEVHNAELIEGIVYMPSPVSADHGVPHFKLGTWLGVYVANTAGVEGGDNTMLRLDNDNAPQPDNFLRKLSGRSRVVDGYFEGAPELVAEIAASSASYDLHDKLNAYRRNGVREYIVFRTLDREVDWFTLRDEKYVKQTPDANGVYRSEEFPGLWLDAPALVAGDLPKLLQTLNAGLAAEGRLPA